MKKIGLLAIIISITSYLHAGDIQKVVDIYNSNHAGFVTHFDEIIAKHNVDPIAVFKTIADQSFLKKNNSTTYAGTAIALNFPPSLVDTLLTKEPELASETNNMGGNAFYDLVSYKKKTPASIEAYGEILKKHNVNINHPNNNGATPLIPAAIYSLQAIDEMLNLGADPTTKIPQSQTNIIHIAVRHSNDEAEHFKQLIQRLPQEILDQQTSDGETPLMVSLDYPNAIAPLLKAGADPRVKVVGKLSFVDLLALHHEQLKGQLPEILNALPESTKEEILQAATYNQSIQNPDDLIAEVMKTNPSTDTIKRVYKFAQGGDKAFGTNYAQLLYNASPPALQKELVKQSTTTQNPPSDKKFYETAVFKWGVGIAGSAALIGLAIHLYKKMRKKATDDKQSNANLWEVD